LRLMKYLYVSVPASFVGCIDRKVVFCSLCMLPSLQCLSTIPRQYSGQCARLSNERGGKFSLAE
jgi:hypothetical protein